MDSPLLIGAALVLFVLAFARTEFGLYVVVFSMLLSPEITAGGSLAERREVTFRTEDFVLLVIGFSWFAKTAVNKSRRERAEAAKKLRKALAASRYAKLRVDTISYPRA